MGYVKLSTKSVGSVVKIKVNGTLREFLVVHQGKPSSSYDDSCNGTWVLMKDIYTTKTWGNSSNEYADGTIHSYLNGEFLNLIDSNIRGTIKQVKVPYVIKFGGTSTSNVELGTGANGLSCKVFLLSGYECGWTTSASVSFPKDGAKLAYFGYDYDGASTRIANYGGTASNWWTRSAYTGSRSEHAWANSNVGKCLWHSRTYSYGIRPAMVLPSSTLFVNDSGVVSTRPLTVSTDAKDIGTKTAAFDWKYTATDVNGGSLTVIEELDGTSVNTQSGVASGTKKSFSRIGDAKAFQKILNGSHTLKVTASSGIASAAASATFVKAVHSASITLTSPMEADAQITLCAISVSGSIPRDASFKVEVTNNAKDSAPVWEDCTSAVQAGRNYVFENANATNGFAFNFRVNVARGASGEAGYITSVQGGFQ